MQANDYSETALKFLRSKSRKNVHFHNKIQHRTQTFVSSHIWSEAGLLKAGENFMTKNSINQVLPKKMMSDFFLDNAIQCYVM